MKKIILIFSGGMDSTTLLYDLRQENEVEAISFNYGQRHKRELEMASKTCEKLNIPHKVVDISSINELLQGSALTSDIKIPEGHYEEESMKLTVVPNRNMIFIALAIGYAVSKDFDTVAIAVHSGDHTIYPDCRPQFIYEMFDVAQHANYKPIAITAPYLFLDKGEIVKRGRELGVDYSFTWTCYKGKEKACGKCGSCRERLEAFEKVGIKDLLEYEL